MDVVLDDDSLVYKVIGGEASVVTACILENFLKVLIFTFSCLNANSQNLYQRKMYPHIYTLALRPLFAKLNFVLLPTVILEDSQNVRLA